MSKVLRKVTQSLRRDGITGTTRKAWRKVAKKVRPFKDGVEGNMPLSLIPADARQVFIFASVPYYDVGGGQRSAQLAKTFFRMGMIVHYIFAQPSAEAKVYHMDIPTATHRYVNNVSPKFLKSIVKEGDIAIFEVPHKKFQAFVPALQEKGARIVYENIDNWETDLGQGLFSAMALVKILQATTVFTATAKPLKVQLEGYLKKNALKGEVLYLPNAVDDTLFDSKAQYRKPRDLKTTSKTLIYYGSLWGQWFDWSLIDGVAEAHPDMEIYLIGDAEHVKDRVNEAPANIHFLGAKKQSELPAYLAYSDIALIPFKPDEIGEYVSPLKVFEYIAMGKVVLATPLPDILEYPNVFTGLTTKDWNKLLTSNALKPVSESKREAFVRRHNWTDRCEAIIRAVDQTVL